MAVGKDGRRTLSLSSFLITLGLAVYLGYLSVTGGFWTGIGDLWLTIYTLLMAVCGGFALSSCLHLIMAPKKTQSPNPDNNASVTNQTVDSPQAKEITVSHSKVTRDPKATNKHVESKPPARTLAQTQPVTPPPPVKAPVPVAQNSNSEPQAVKLIGPVVKNNQQFLDTFIKLASIAKTCQELVENERELSKKEQVRLSLQRREFKQMYSMVKNSRFETF